MKKILIIPIFAISFLACESDEITKKQAIDSDIQVVLKELLAPQGSVWVLECETEKIYPCDNYGISYAQRYDLESITLTFLEVPEIETCLTALGPATTMIGLGSITGNGEYEISLNNGAVENKGTLTLTDTEIILELSSENGIEIMRKTTKRVPLQTYWGTVGYAADSLTEKATEFITELQSINGVDAFNKQLPGIYSYYEINQNGEIEPDSPSGYHYTIHFIFQYNSDNEAGFKSHLEALTTSYSNNLTINFQNSKGEGIYNRE